MKVSGLKQGYAALNASDWVGEIPFPLFEGVKLKVRRLWNSEWAALAEKLGDETSDLSKDANDVRIERECLARACLDDWKGIDDAYTPELAIELLADPEAGRDFRNALLWCANQREGQVKAQLEADEKN